MDRSFPTPIARVLDVDVGSQDFNLREVVLPEGSERPYVDADWADALVVVVQGEIELECAAGGRRRFRSSAILWLVGLDIRVVRNVGCEPAVLVAISRPDR